MFDIDIDVPPNIDKSKYGVRAIIYDADVKEIRPHNSGVYYKTNIPIDVMTGKAAIDYKDAEEHGWIKYDMLNSSEMLLYDSREEFLECVSKEPDWSMLWTEYDLVQKLPHVKRHFDILRRLKPKSIIELADILALIRPAKAYLLDRYVHDKEYVRTLLYAPEGDSYYFKKSHAVAYAMMIVASMNSKKRAPIEKFFKIS